MGAPEQAHLDTRQLSLRNSLLVSEATQQNQRGLALRYLACLADLQTGVSLDDGAQLSWFRVHCITDALGSSSLPSATVDIGTLSQSLVADKFTDPNHSPLPNVVTFNPMAEHGVTYARLSVHPDEVTGTITSFRMIPPARYLTGL